MSETNIYAVRLKDTFELVGFFGCEAEFGEMLLAFKADECTNITRCEYKRVTDFSLFWTGRGPLLRNLETEIDSGPPCFSEGLFEDLYNPAGWTPFGTGTIYFVKAGNLVKIGYTTDLKNRLNQLQTGNGEKLELLFTRAGTRADEKALHDHFKLFRQTGEWFDLTLDLQLELNRLKGQAEKARYVYDAASL